MITNNEKLTVSVKEAAIMLGISKNLAYSLARCGKLPGVIHLGSKRMVVSRAVIERVLNGDNEVQEIGDGKHWTVSRE